MRYGVTEDFYLTEYGGTQLNNFERSINQAEYAVESATDYRIGDIEDLPSFSKRQVMLAVCAQASHNDKRSELDGLDGLVGSYSIGDVSISLEGQEDDSLSKHYGLCSEAVSFLMPTGLLDRRIR